MRRHTIPSIACMTPSLESPELLSFEVLVRGVLISARHCHDDWCTLLIASNGGRDPAVTAPDAKSAVVTYLTYVGQARTPNSDPITPTVLLKLAPDFQLPLQLVRIP